MIKADLHLHSKYSWDSKVEITQYIHRAEELGYDVISITDHNSTESHAELPELQVDTEVLLIPGQEVTTLDGHLLVYGTMRTLDSGLPMKETIENAKSENPNSICVAAHPFDILRKGKGKKILNVGADGIEVQNASALFGWFNRRAKKVANQFKINLGNSDSHRLEEFGTSYTLLPKIHSFEEFVLELSNGKAAGKRIGLLNKTNRFIRRKFF